MDLAPDFDEFIGSLITQRTEFLVVDAYALAFHGAPRFTGDIDFFVRKISRTSTRWNREVRRELLVHGCAVGTIRDPLDVQVERWHTPLE